MRRPEKKNLNLSFFIAQKCARLLLVVLILTMGGTLRVAVSGETGSVVFSATDLTIVSAAQSHRFRVEIANTRAKRERGLMARRNLDQDAGMLFIYEKPRRIRMWMKNTFIPLDMLFIDTMGIITGIRANTIPHSTKTIASSKNVIGVLELNGGTAARLGIKTGDRIESDLFIP